MEPMYEALCLARMGAGIALAGVICLMVIIYMLTKEGNE